MKKKRNELTYRLLIFNGLILAILLIIYQLHAFFVSGLSLPYNLWSIYLFFSISSIVVISFLEWLHTIMPDKVAYAFLIALFLKMGFFLLLYASKGLLDKPMLFSARISLLIPLFIFLFFEVIVVSLRLNLIGNSKKEL
jgi:hypothetical protein